MREKEVGKPLPSLRLEQTARFGCTVTVLFNTRRDTKETDIKMEKSTRHASNTVNERQTRYRFPIARAEVCHDKLRWTSSKSCYYMMDMQNVLPSRTVFFFFQCISIRFKYKFSFEHLLYGLLFHDLYQEDSNYLPGILFRVEQFIFRNVSVK